MEWRFYCNPTERQGLENHPIHHHHEPEVNSHLAAPEETGTICSDSEGKGLKLSEEPSLREKGLKKRDYSLLVVPRGVWVTPPVIVGILVRIFQLVQRVQVDKAVIVLHIPFIYPNSIMGFLSFFSYHLFPLRAHERLLESLCNVVQKHLRSVRNPNPSAWCLHVSSRIQPQVPSSWIKHSCR